MSYADEITAALRAIAAARPDLTAQAGEHHFQHLSVVLAKLQERLREQLQAATQTEIGGVIATLDAGADPTPTQLDLIRLWVVGDAEHYVRLEGDYRTWLAELDRLVGELSQVQGATLTVADLTRVAAWARDAQRVLADIEYFKQEEARVQRFEQAAKGLTADDKRTLANILRQKLASDRT